MLCFNKFNQRGATAIFMTMVILSAILVVSLSASDMVLKGMKYGKTRYDSAKAFYAAETGAEQIMWEIRKKGTALLPVGGVGFCQDDPGEFCFNDVNDTTIVSCENDCTASSYVNSQELDTDLTFNLEFDLDVHSPVQYSSTTLLSIGKYRNEVRKIKLTYRSGDGN